MGQDTVIRTLLGLCAAVLVLGALSLAQSIFAPVAFAVFIIAIAWPFQSWLQQRIPKLLALAVTLLAILVIITVMGWLMIWGFSKIASWLINNAVRFQILYAQATEWLEGHGISLASQIVDNFNFGWALRAVQEVIGRLHGMTSFVIITFVFVLLGMLEVDIAKRNIARLKNQAIAQSLVQAGTEIAAKFQKYMLVRSVMSFLTGTVIWLVALFAGLELATAWGVIAFVLNYIPFLGPLVATVFPTLFAFAQFESLAARHPHLCLPQPGAVSDRQLFRAAFRRRDAVGVAVPHPVRGVLLDLFVGHRRRLHRRADRDRDPDAL